MHSARRLLVRKLDGMWFAFEQHTIYDRDTNTYKYDYPRGIVNHARCYTTFEHLYEALISRKSLGMGWATADTATIARHRAIRIEEAEIRRVENAAYDAQLEADRLRRNARRRARGEQLPPTPDIPRRHDL